MSPSFKKRLSVLVVENNPIDEKVINSMLAKSDYGHFRQFFVSELDDAFELLSTKSFDVVLLDLNLPETRGLETLKKVHKKFPDVAIVVNTGAYQDVLGLKAITRGAQDYLIKGKYKPYTISKSLYYAVERKKAEKDLKSAYNRLKEMQGQLIQAEKMNVVGGIASGIAHEVKNPLATILYGVEFLNLKCRDKDDKIKLTLNSITDAAKKSNEIVKDLLDFAGLSNLQKKSTDVSTIIKDSLKLVKHQCAKKNIKIYEKYVGKLPPIKIDKNRIEQVVVDVLLNSIHAITEGGVIRIRVYSQDLPRNKTVKIYDDEKTIKPGDHILVIEIKDNGPGIPEENLSKIFDPFFTTRRAAGGVGLGLSIARTIMRNHNGVITLSNSKRKGAQAELIFKI